MARQDMTIAIKAKDLTQAALKNINRSMRKVNASIFLAQKRFPKLRIAVKGVTMAYRGLRNVLGFVVAGLKSVAKFAAIASLAGVGIFSFMVKSSLSATDNLAKTARKIGTTTEALAKMRFAADLTGVAASTMDMALQRFTRRTAEAAKGTGEAKGALRELNIDAKAMLKLPLDEQMKELSKAFEGVKTPADKVRLAMKLFDSEGVALVNTLGLGKEALTEMMDEADALGITLSTKAAQGVEDANDSFIRLGSLLRGFRDNTVASLAPAIQAVTDKLVAFGKEAAGGDFENIGTVIANKIIEGFKNIIIVLQNLLNTMGKTAHEIKRIYRNIFSSEETKKNEAELERLMSAARKAGINVRKALDPEKLSGGMARGVDTYLDGLSQEQRNILVQINKVRNELNQIENRETAIYEPFDFSDLLGNLKDIQDKVGVVDDKANIKVKVDTSSITKAREAFNAWSESIDPIDQQLQNLAVNAMNGFTDSITNAITGTAKFSDSIKSMARSVIDSLTKMLVQYYITKPLFDAITGMIGGGGSSDTSFATVNAGMRSGFEVGSSVSAPSFNGGGFTGSGSRSGGIDGLGGFPAILHPNETVIDHTKGQGLAQKTSNQNIVVNQTVNITTGIQSTVRAEIQNLMPQINESTKAAVAEARSRGGSYSKALLGV